jgi:porphyrinogen peroxidase
MTQPGILAPLPSLSRYLTFELRGSDARGALERFAGAEPGDDAVLGFGAAFLQAAGATIPGMRPFPRFPDSKVALPHTPSAVWLWLRGSDRGDLVHATRRWQALAGADFVTTSVVDSFVHRDSRDLSGYVDGTENPTGDEALRHGIMDGDGPTAGSSFVAVQRWRHDFAALERMSQGERDDSIGRRISDNEELGDAPESAHVKRTAQEDFEPEAFIVRRSMPWADPGGSGLHFVAFGRSLDAFDAQLFRMSGAEDGIVDAVFRFTQPETGATFWCPPLSGDQLDLSAALS